MTDRERVHAERGLSLLVSFRLTRWTALIGLAATVSRWRDADVFGAYEPRMPGAG